MTNKTEKPSQLQKVSVEEILTITEVIDRIRRATGWKREVWAAILLALGAGSGITLGLTSWLNMLVFIAMLQAP